MNFCVKCNNFLYLKEINHEDKRVLFYYCKKCDYKTECKNNKISFKIYKKTINNSKSNVSYLNKYKVNDLTLPRKNIKCPKCKKINNNPYERKYFNNSFQLNIICSNDKCNYNWFA